MPDDKPQNQYLKSIAELRYFDDKFARTCLKDSEPAVMRILKTILGTDDLTIESYETQSDILNIDRRSVILDVHAVDSNGKHYAIEIETSASRAIPQRARFISGMLDSRILNKGGKAKELAESYVIFISEPDIFNNKQKAIHRFDRYDTVDGTPLNDGSHIIYVNGEYEGEDDIGKLIHDFLCKDPDEMYFEELAEPARFYKKTEEGKEIMGSVFDKVREEGREEGRMEGREEGREEGAVKNSKDIAMRMIELKEYTLEKIAEITQLPISDLEKLKTESLKLF